MTYENGVSHDAHLATRLDEVRRTKAMRWRIQQLTGHCSYHSFSSAPLFYFSVLFASTLIHALNVKK